MPGETKDESHKNSSDERVSVVLERAKNLSSELTDTVGELAELLKNYDKGAASGT